MQKVETSEPPKPAVRRSNIDRLRGHLKTGSLASQLLDAWLAGEAIDTPTRMRAALDARTANTQESDATAPNPQA